MQITAPVELIRWLRANGYVLSRVFREAAEHLMGGDDAGRIEQQLDYHRGQVRILESARATLGERAEKVAAAQQRVEDRLAEIRKIAEAYWSSDRSDASRFPLAVNLRWLEGRIARIPSLRSSDPAQVLEQIRSMGREGAE